MRYRFTNEHLSTTIGTIGLPMLARALLTLIGSCRIYYIFKIKAGRFRKRYLSRNRFAKETIRVCVFEKILFTFIHHCFRYRCQWLASSFELLFLDPWLGTSDRIYFNSRRVDPNSVCSAVGTHSARNTGKYSILS